MVMNVGIIGCGNIAPAYIKGCAEFADLIRVTACADIQQERAEAFAAEHQLTAFTVAELLAEPSIDLVINLTIPMAHAEVSHKIIAAGKHLYSEKPLGLNREEGRGILEAAKTAGVRVGCAPDTFMGGGIQTCRQVIDSGKIGAPVAAVAFMANHGHESWHPGPAFYYQPGGGPMFDMGPYYLTTLVSLLGPMRRVSATAKKTFDERVARHPSISGQVIPVNTTTHLTGTVDFVDGTAVTVITSFDVWRHNLPIIEIYGTEGSLSVPNPNGFSGEVRVWTPATEEWEVVPHIARTDVHRGIGVADMARAIGSDEPHLASGELAYHVLDAMAAFDESSAQGHHIELTSTCDRPAPNTLTLL